MGKRGDTDLFEVLSCELGQDFGIDRIGVENRNILLKA